MKLDNKRISEVADEAVRLKRENPSWSYKKAVDTAKEIYREVK